MELYGLCFWKILPPLKGVANHENTHSRATEDKNTVVFWVTVVPFPATENSDCKLSSIATM